MIRAVVALLAMVAAAQANRHHSARKNSWPHILWRICRRAGIEHSALFRGGTTASCKRRTTSTFAAMASAWRSLKALRAAPAPSRRASPGWP